MRGTVSGRWSGAPVGTTAAVSGWLASRFDDIFWRSVVVHVG